MKKDKLLIFGTGSVSYDLLRILNYNNIEIIAFVNSDTAMKEFCNKPVITPDEIVEYSYDYIVIASGYVEKMRQILLDLNVDQSKIVCYIFDDITTFQGIRQAIDLYVNNTYHRDLMTRWIMEKLPDFYPAIFWKADDALCGVKKDFVREQLMKLLAKQIDEKGLQGAIAECGVYKGDFTVVIDEVFSGKQLYLFDTFEGFDLTDIEKDNAVENVIGEKEKFKDSSEQLVLDRLLNSNNIICIKKGYFPDSYDLDEQKFCFVSIDFNLYKPVKEALRIFYDRLEKGGYILISDYAAPFYSGTKKAVDEWSLENGKTIVPLPDFYGSALIIKE